MKIINSRGAKLTLKNHMLDNYIISNYNVIDGKDSIDITKFHKSLSDHIDFIYDIIVICSIMITDCKRFKVFMKCLNRFTNIIIDHDFIFRINYTFTNILIIDCKERCNKETITLYKEQFTKESFVEDSFMKLESYQYHYNLLKEFMKSIKIDNTYCDEDIDKVKSKHTIIKYENIELIFVSYLHRYTSYIHGGKYNRNIEKLVRFYYAFNEVFKVQNYILEQMVTSTI